MLTGWVTADGDQVVNEENTINTSTTSPTYYCDETGARVESGWVYTTAPSTPDDDADADEYWYYLKSSGKVATGKQSNVKGQGFVFGNKPENMGQMLTGWVAGKNDNPADKNSKMLYEEIGNEDSQEELSKWVKSNSEDEAEYAVYYCMYDEDKADGHIQKNKWRNLGLLRMHTKKMKMRINSGTGSIKMVKFISLVTMISSPLVLNMN